MRGLEPTRGRRKKTWHEVVENDVKSLHQDKFGTIGRKKWRKSIRGRQVRGDETGDSE